MASRRCSTHFTGRPRWIDDRLHAEPAADVLRHDAHAVLGQAQQPGQEVARQVRHLRPGPERELALGGVPVGHAAASLQRRGGQAVRAERALDDGCGFRQGRLDVPLLEATGEQDVAGGVRVHLWCAGPCRRPHVHRRRPRLVVDADQRGGVLGRVAVRRHDRRERLAAVPYVGPGQERLLGLDVIRQGRAGAHAAAGDRRIPTRQDVDDGRMGPGLPGVETAQAGVRVRAAHEGHVEQARQLHVADVAAAAREQAAILAPADRRAEGGRHALCVRPSRSRR
jgi:hypothetical protein